MTLREIVCCTSKKPLIQNVTRKAFKNWKVVKSKKYLSRQCTVGYCRASCGRNRMNAVCLFWVLFLFSWASNFLSNVLVLKLFSIHRNWSKMFSRSHRIFVIVYILHNVEGKWCLLSHEICCMAIFLLF